MALSLGRLRRQGFAVSAVLLAFNEIERIDSAGPLIAQGIPVRALSDEERTVSVLRASARDAPLRSFPALSGLIL